VITVKLNLHHYPSTATLDGKIEDWIYLKSAYFDQKVPVSFTLYNSKPKGSSTRLGSSKALNVLSSSNVSVGSATDKSKKEDMDLIQQLNNQIKYKSLKIKEMENIIGHLESKNPNIQQIVHSRLEMERKVFD
jgi:hypothetical protein